MTWGKRLDHSSLGTLSNLDQSTPFEMAMHFSLGKPSSSSLDFTPSDTPTKASVFVASHFESFKRHAV